MGLNMLKIRGEWYTIQNKKQQRIEFSNWDRGHPTGKPGELGDLTWKLIISCDCPTVANLAKLGRFNMAVFRLKACYSSFVFEN